MPRSSPRRRRRAAKGHVLGGEKAERRRRRLRRRRLLVVLGLVAAVAAALALYRSPLLRVGEVEVVGATNVDSERVAELANLEGASMLDAPLDDAEARIVELALVRAVRASLSWPDKVRIEVVERSPWGYWDLAGTSYAIDSEGVVLPDVTPPEGAPVIHDTGDPALLSPGDYVDRGAVSLAQALLTSVPEQLTLEIVRLEYRPESGLSLLTDAGYRVVMGDGENVDYKLAVWRTLEEDLGRAAMAGHVLDLRFRDRPSFQ